MEQDEGSQIIHWVKSIENEHTVVDPYQRYRLKYTAEDKEFQILIPCHSATMYWLLCTKESRYISGQEFMAFTNSDASTRIKELVELAESKKILIPLTKDMKMIPGAVIVFIKDGDTKHSCIAITNSKIGGYNQVNWFTTSGGDHKFSIHKLKEFKWLSSWTDSLPFSSNKNRAKNLANGNNDRHAESSLFMIPPEIALEYVATLHG